MARYTVRVELHDADTEDYEKLYMKMESRGFMYIIVTKEGTGYFLPDAEYNYEGPETMEQVLAKAKRAASAVTKDFGILVTKTSGQMFFGLEEIPGKVLMHNK